MQVADEPLEAWFRREILDHQESLTRFLIRLWPAADDIADLRQEAYARVYSAALRRKPDVPKAFLFATARHLIADRARRNRVVTFCPCGDTAVFDRLLDEVSPEQEVLALLELVEVSRALRRLPAKCRQVVWMRRLQGLPQREVAERLGVSEKAIEKHLSIGVRRLREVIGRCESTST